jgi:hypothetical protein
MDEQQIYALYTGLRNDKGSTPRPFGTHLKDIPSISMKGIDPGGSL